MTLEGGYKRTWQPTDNYQFLTGEWYDSRMEGNDTALLKLLGGIEWTSQGLSYTVPFIPYGSYKPDMWYAMMPNSLHSIRSARQPRCLVEYKGWADGWRNEATREFLADLVDDPGDEVVRAVWVMRDDLRMLVYDGKSKQWEQGAIYQCGHCGHTYHAVKGRHECPYCANANVKFITDKPNGLFMDLWGRISKETCRRMDKAYSKGQRINYKVVAAKVISEMAAWLRAKNREYKPAERQQVRGLDKDRIEEAVKEAYSEEGEENQDGED